MLFLLLILLVVVLLKVSGSCVLSTLTWVFVLRLHVLTLPAAPGFTKPGFQKFMLWGRAEMDIHTHHSLSRGLKEMPVPMMLSLLMDFGSITVLQSGELLRVATRHITFLLMECWVHGLKRDIH